MDAALPPTASGLFSTHQPHSHLCRAYSVRQRFSLPAATSSPQDATGWLVQHSFGTMQPRREATGNHFRFCPLPFFPFWLRAQLSVSAPACILRLLRGNSLPHSPVPPVSLRLGLLPSPLLACPPFAPFGRCPGAVLGLHPKMPLTAFACFSDDGNVPHVQSSNCNLDFAKVRLITFVGFCSLFLTKSTF